MKYMIVYAMIRIKIYHYLPEKYLTVTQYSKSILYHFCKQKSRGGSVGTRREENDEKANFNNNKRVVSTTPRFDDVPRLYIEYRFYNIKSHNNLLSCYYNEKFYK